MTADAVADEPPRPAPSQECIARYQRGVDDGLSASEIDSIKDEVRRQSDDPIVAITFEPTKRSGRASHAVIKVKLLGYCDETRAGGRNLYFRRVKNGWRFDRKLLGSWASGTDIIAD